jgi:hypothetical protein
VLPPAGSGADPWRDTTIERGVEHMALHTDRAGRWTDRVEDMVAWVLLTAALLLVLFACILGIGIHDRLVQQGQAEALDRVPASATLLESAPTLASAYSTSAPVKVRATWEDRWGAEHSGSVTVPPGLDNGSSVPIWVDRSGAAVPKPMTRGDALGVAGITAGLVIAAGVTTLAVLWAVLRRWLMVYNCAA